MSARVDHDLLADYVGGALDGTPQAQKVADLIATSPDWRRAADELSAALTAVTRDLDALREQTVVMPADVAARFDELFTSPAMAGKTAAAQDPLAPREVTRHAGRRRRWRRWAAPLAIAAASLAFVGFGGLAPFTSNPFTSKPQSGSAEDAFTASQARVPMAAPNAVPTVASWHHYDRLSLQGPGRVAAAGTASAQAKSPPSSVMGAREGQTGELTRLIDLAALRGCLSAVAVVLPGKATLVEYAFFEERPALVISITSFTEQWKFVAGPSCGVSGPDELYRTPLK